MKLVDMVREGIHMRLEQLDEKEILFTETKRMRERTAAEQRNTRRPSGLPSTGFGMSGQPPKVEDQVNDMLNKLPPEKIRASFRKWAEYLEASDGKLERKIRMQDIHDEVKERTKSAEEANTSLTAFDEFMAERADAKLKTVPTPEAAPLPFQNLR